jgi:hypothetical protein
MVYKPIIAGSNIPNGVWINVASPKIDREDPDELYKVLEFPIEVPTISSILFPLEPSSYQIFNVSVLLE